MSTASDHRLMESEKCERLFCEVCRLIAERPGGRIRKYNLTSHKSLARRTAALVDQHSDNVP